MTSPFKTRGGLFAAILVIVCLLAAGLAMVVIPKPTATALGDNPSYFEKHPNVLTAGVLGGLAVLLAGLALIWERKVARNVGDQDRAIEDVMRELGLAADRERANRPTPPPLTPGAPPNAAAGGGAGQEVDTKWKEGVAIEADAYAKPWYILCGETGTGKSNLLARGELPMARSKKTSQELPMPRWESGTLGLDWWFFEQSVVLDTAGNLLTDHGPRWLNFLKKVKTVRPAEPINGMIVAVSAESLQATPPDLQERVRHIAGQMTAARQILGVRFPVYVLITKADMIGGFSEFFPVAGDPRIAHQIMGWSSTENPLVEETTFRSNSIREHLKELVDRLKQRRTMLITQPPVVDNDSDRRIDQLDQLYAFPENLLGLADNLKVYLDAIIPPNQSGSEFPPFFRGVYLTSSVRKGEALDRDLAEAFGLTTVPKTVSVSSERSFFIKDLLTSKIIAESGLVTPLQAVRTTFKHRRVAVFAASAAAAVVVLAATGLGITQLAGKIKPHRDYWRNVAKQVDTAGPAQLALYDASAAYRGTSAPDVLTVQTDNVRLIKNDTRSWLLPMSSGLDKKRRQAHAAVYFHEAVFPTIDATAARLPSDSAAEWGAARVKAMTDLATLISKNEPLSTAKYAERAASMVKGASASAEERAAVETLFAADADWPADPVSLDATQRRRLAGRLQAAIKSWAAAQVNERAWTERLALMNALNRAANREDELLKAVKADPSVANWAQQRDKIDARALRPASIAGWGDFEQAVVDGVAPPARVIAVIDQLDALFKDGKDTASTDAKAAVDAARDTVYQSAAARKQTVVRLLGISPGVDEAGLKAKAREYEQLYVGADWSSPNLARRADAYRSLATAAGDSANAAAIRKCKYLSLEPALTAADDFATKATPQALAVSATDPLGKRADEVCRLGVAALRKELRSAAWQSALVDGKRAWAAPESEFALAPAAPLVERTGPLPELTIEPAGSHDNVESWLNSWAKLRQASASDGVPEPQLSEVDAAVEAYRDRVVADWNRQISTWAKPGALNWTRIHALANQLQKPADITAALRRVQTARDDVLRLLGRPAGGPPPSSDARDAQIKLTAEAITRIAENNSSADARRHLVTLPAESLPDYKPLLDRIKPDGANLAPAVVDPNDLAGSYWSELSTAVIRGIVDANRPEIDKARNVVLQLGRDTFPFTRGGIKSATAKQMEDMDHTASFLRPNDERARGLPVVLKYVLSPGFHDRADWDNYLSAVVRITAAVRQKAVFDVVMRKPADVNGLNEQGKWSGISVKYTTADGQPAQYGPASYTAGLEPIRLNNVALGSELDIKLYAQLENGVPVGEPLFDIVPSPTIPYWLYRLVDQDSIRWTTANGQPAFEGDLPLQPQAGVTVPAAALRVRLIPKDGKPLPPVPTLPK